MLEGIVMLRGRKREHGDAVADLCRCCQQNDPRDFGCGFRGLCNKLYDKCDSAWEWTEASLGRQTRASAKGAACRSVVSDWLDAPTPGLEQRSLTLLDILDEAW